MCSFRHVNGNTALPVRAAGAARELLLGIDAGFIVVALVLVVVLALIQGRFARRAIASVAIVVCSVVSVEALKHGLPRLGPAIPAGRAADIPERAYEHRGLGSGLRSCSRRRRCCGRQRVSSGRPMRGSDCR